MRNKVIMGLVLAQSVALAGHVAAQDKNPRFQFKPIEGGFVRLDTLTGTISTCRRASGHLVCRTAADDRQVLQAEIERLQRDVDQLRHEVERLKKPAKPTKPAKPVPKPKTALPADRELDRIMTMFENLARRFLDFARSMRDRLERQI
jgi:outer membrane murein-binding lipoprotein Lpp